MKIKALQDAGKTNPIQTQFAVDMLSSPAVWPALTCGEFVPKVLVERVEGPMNKLPILTKKVNQQMKKMQNEPNLLNT